jgi:ribosome biogenesis GTPase
MRGRRSMPVPGDIAFVRPLEDGSTVIERLEPRAMTLTRRTAEGRAKTIAANVDTLVIVMALAQPPPRFTILDQLLAFAELEGITAIVVWTKPDLATPEEVLRRQGLYEALGYATLVVNPKSGSGVETLRTMLLGRKALLGGISGVGKSSIFRSLGGEAVVGEVSRHGLGRQTTTTARLCRLDGGFLIDSPGVGDFGLGGIAPRELAAAFVEMRDVTERCRFADCTHLHEPGCGIRQAVERGEIEPERYASYRQILGALHERPGHDMVQGVS